MVEDNVLTEQSTGLAKVDSVHRDGCGQTTEDRLRLVRRLDWRFLLPNPCLNQVVYLGEYSQSLVEALEHFSGKVTLADPGASNGAANPEACDLTICRGPARQNIDRAFSALKPGGHIYWELPQKGVRHFKSFVGVVKKAGFREVAVHWHRPDFDNCLDIVPLGDKRALGYFFSKDGADLKGRLKSAAGWLLRTSGLLNYLTPSVSIIACKPENIC